MGHWTSDGGFIPGKVQAVQMEKNRVRKRANLSERSMRRIRAILQDPDVGTDSDIVEAIIDALDDWEENMERLDKCGAPAEGELSDSVCCGLPVGHKSLHVGIDGSNHRHSWSTTPIPQEVS